jgi:6-phosphogluconolactonase
MASVAVSSDLAALIANGAARLTARAETAIAARGSAMVSLTGGNTPRGLYQALADPAGPWRGRIDWPRVHLFWGDERHVPPDHHESNFGMANDALVRHVPIPPAQVHRMRGELPDAHEAARLYEEEVRGVTFDVMLLGLGDDAHIGSIFPGSELLEHDGAPDGRARVAGVWAPHLNAWRITLTPPAMLDSRTIVMFVAGANKADAVYAATAGPLDVARWPAQLLRTAGDRVEWLIDSAAAARLPAAPPA